MSEMPSHTPHPAQHLVALGLRRRYRRDALLRHLCRISTFIAVSFVAVLCSGIVWFALPGLKRHEVLIQVDFPQSLPQSGLALPNLLSRGFHKVASASTDEALGLISPGAHRVLWHKMRHKPHLLGHTKRIWLPLNDTADQFLKGKVSRASGEDAQQLSDPQIELLEQWQRQNQIRSKWHTKIFTHSDSRLPDQAGLFSAFLGSLWLLLITFMVACPLGVAAAIYLEEFAKPGFLSRLIEVNISNLAAVPSIVFGLLGFAVFLSLGGLPRSSVLVGGLTLSLMALPTIIIATRTALRTVPKSLRDAALGLGASRIQTTFHQVLPLALPGIATGTLISLSRTLGETAPLLMVGMMAYVGSSPTSPLDPSSALPVQVFNWARLPEPGFLANAAVGLMVLLVLLGLLNWCAFKIREKCQVSY
ncbi:MAG: phosphate ABC transporter permease PstA [Holosporales bacterium]